MRFFEFRQTLDELNMSPGNLKAMAGKIEGALVGMEFEMVVPGVQDPDDYDVDPEPDYEYDRRIRARTWRDFEDEIRDFFSSGDFGSTRGEIKRALESANEELQGYIDDMYGSSLEDGGLEDWWKENHEGEEMPEPGSGMYDRAEERYREQFYEDMYNSDSTIREWLEFGDYSTLSEFAQGFNLEWPHITYPEAEVADDLESLAADFGETVGLGVDISKDYHGQKKSTKNFTIEPDGSIRGDGAGLEFVSPPLPVDQMIDVLGKTVKWAKEKGCETNKSTGLHMNVSVPNYDLENLDYVKLALFVGDDWVAEQFGRLGADYADSSISKIKGAIQVNPDKIPAYLDTMKAGLNKIASRLIHSNQTQKYVSLNVQNNRLEFRSPGGDWLNEDLNKLVNTMLRFVVALDIACDPAKNKKEYDTKLYKLIAGAAPGGDNTIQAFALYSSGQMPKEILLRHLRQRKMTRQATKAAPGKYTIHYVPGSGPEQTVVIDADSEKDAVAKFHATHEWFDAITKVEKAGAAASEDKNWTIHYNPSETDYRERLARAFGKTKEEAIENFYREIGSRVPVVLRVVPQG